LTRIKFDEYEFKTNKDEKGLPTSVGPTCYRQSLFTTLQSGGLEVILGNGKFTKNIKGKKTDVKDCQWIHKLYTLGSLSGTVSEIQSIF